MALGEYLTRVMITLLGLVYPGYQSFKAVKHSDVPKQQAWLKYWLVFAVVSFGGLIVEPFLSERVPLWPLVKIAMVGFLALPLTNGYERIYHMVLEPQLERHEETIDATAAKVVRAGEEHARKIGPEVNRLVQRGRDVAQKALNKKTT